MNILENILIVLQVISSVLLMILVLLQSEKESSNMITGGAETSSAMGMSRDKKLAKYTRVIGAIFAILTIASATVMLYNAK